MSGKAGFTQIGFDVPEPAEMSPEELEESITRGDFVGDELEEAQKLLEEKKGAEEKEDEKEPETERNADGGESDESQGDGSGESSGSGTDEQETEEGNEEEQAGDEKPDETQGSDDETEGDATVEEKEEEEELPQTVPLARLSKEVKRRKELEARLEQLESMLKKKPSKEAQDEKEEIEDELDQYFTDNKEQEPEVDQVLAELNQKYLEHLDMGETEEAAKVFSQIQERQIAIAEERAYSRLQAQNIEAEVSKAQGLYDSIVSNNKDLFDEDPVAFDTFNAAIDKYAENGLTPKEAVARAGKVLRLLPEKKEEVDTGAVNEVKEKQSKKNVKNAEKLGNQPPSLKKVGQGASDGITDRAKNFLEMTEEEFKSLSDEEKKRLRGDYVE